MEDSHDVEDSHLSRLKALQTNRPRSMDVPPGTVADNMFLRETSISMPPPVSSKKLVKEFSPFGVNVPGSLNSMVIDDLLNEEDSQLNPPSVDDDQVTNPFSEVDDRRMSLREQQYNSERRVPVFPPTPQQAR